MEKGKKYEEELEEETWNRKLAYFTTHLSKLLLTKGEGRGAKEVS